MSDFNAIKIVLIPHNRYSIFLCNSNELLKQYHIPGCSYLFFDCELNFLIHLVVVCKETFRKMQKQIKKIGNL